LRPVTTRVEAGSLLYPSPGAACGVRAATNVRLMEVILGALAGVVPERIPAAGAGQAAVFLVAVPDEQRYGALKVSVVEPLCGGSGGRPFKDGVDGTDSLTGGLRNIPIETLEADMPLLIERYGLRVGSAGAGRFRGGYGVEIEFRLLADQATVTGRNIDRYRFRPWGREGGQPGSLGDAWLERANGHREPLGRPDILHLEDGDLVHLASQGGGGFGNPHERPAELVREDVQNDLLSLADAAAQYAVVIEDGQVVEQATLELRTRGRPGIDTTPERFSFGPERETHERIYPSELRDALVRLVLPLPPAQRQRAWAAAMGAIAERAENGLATWPDDLPALIAPRQVTRTPPL
jgi:N-methylhydantoinase B